MIQPHQYTVLARGTGDLNLGQLLVTLSDQNLMNGFVQGLWTAIQRELSGSTMRLRSSFRISGIKNSSDLIQCSDKCPRELTQESVELLEHEGFRPA